MKFLLIASIILTSCTVDKGRKVDTKEFIGIWQDSPEIASGWSDTYSFFENGEFIYSYNQMVCDKRTLDYSGTWELTELDEIKITVNEKTIVEGGELIPAMESCASEYEIEGGEINKIKDVKTYTIQLSTIRTDTVGPADEPRIYKTWLFDKKRFWKLNDDPRKY